MSAHEREQLAGVGMVLERTPQLDHSFEEGEGEDDEGGHTRHNAGALCRRVIRTARRLIPTNPEPCRAHQNAAFCPPRVWDRRESMGMVIEHGGGVGQWTIPVATGL